MQYFNSELDLHHDKSKDIKNSNSYLSELHIPQKDRDKFYCLAVAFHTSLISRNHLQRCQMIFRLPCIKRGIALEKLKYGLFTNVYKVIITFGVFNISDTDLIWTNNLQPCQPYVHKQWPHPLSWTKMLNTVLYSLE